MAIINTKFDFGDGVYLKHDLEQNERMVTGFAINPGNIIYTVSFGEVITSHYDFEMSHEKDITKI